MPAPGKAGLSWRALTLAGALLVIWAVFFAATGGTFASARNLALLARQMSVTALLSVGMVLVIVTGEIDLSVGAMSGLLGAVATIVSVKAGWPLAAALASALVLGAALGLAQGTIVARMHVPSFIVTLGGMLVFQGTLLGITGGISISPGDAFLRIGQAYLGKGAGWAIAGALAAALLLATFATARAARERNLARRPRSWPSPPS